MSIVEIIDRGCELLNTIISRNSLFFS